MTTTTEMSGAAAAKTPETHGADAHGAEPRKPLKATPDELKAFGLVAVIAALWIGATVLFGFAGLITVALVVVFVMLALLVIISRG